MATYICVFLKWQVLLALAVACITVRAFEEDGTFTDPITSASSHFNHLVVDSKTGRVYIGAVNKIYQLSSDLQIIQSIDNGPVNDSVLCTLDCPSNFVKRPTDNVNKVLLIEYASSRLITCGSVFQGLCSVRNLNDISHDVLESHEPMVANDATASTVAFIAPGPPNAPATQVMYVGVTYTGGSPYRSEVPSVSSRSLENDRLFTIAQSTDASGTKIFVNTLSVEQYPINYVYGFSSEGFSYFLTTQLKSIGSETYHSKIVRVCHNDESYHSYTEIPISCTGGGRESFGYNLGTENISYSLVQAAFVGKIGRVPAEELELTVEDEVLIAAFSQSDSVNKNIPSDSSAICIYSLKAIRRKFSQNIQSCFKGQGFTGLDFITPSTACLNTNVDSINEDFCGLDVNSPLGGDQPLEAIPVITFTERVTAVMATAASDFTALFAGTARGHLKKILLDTATIGFEYAHVVVDEGSPVNKDLYFDTQLMYLYVMTERKVSKVKIQDCGIYTSCLSCIETQDPYCGWCTPQNKCSLRSDCEDAAMDPVYWITYPRYRCTIITQVTPKQLQISTSRTNVLEVLLCRSNDLHIESLPFSFKQYKCAFKMLENNLALTNASRKKDGITCNTPNSSMLPPVPIGQHSYSAKLSVHIDETPDFAATNLTYFDCNTYNSCTQCVSSSFPCDWCVDGHRCTHDTAENCHNDILVTGVSRIGPSYRSGPGFCPTINSTSGDTNEILIPFGEKKAIAVNVHIISQFIVQSKFVCQFNIEGRVTHVNAQLLGDTIYCEAVEFTYTSRAPNITASLAVIWGGSKPLDNPDNVYLHIYKCHDMGDNCGMCLDLPQKFGCGWYQYSNKCERVTQCGSPNIQLSGSQTCQIPNIHSFEPHLGPWEGGTKINIFGTNLGCKISDIYDGVTVAGIKCIPIEELYVKTRQITCTVSSSTGEEIPRDGPVVIIFADYCVESKENYTFVNPKISSILPKYGPKSGGTEVHIKGEFLNAGSNIRAFIDDFPCPILSVSHSKVVCRTSISNQLQTGRLRMHFDNGTRTLESEKFKYVDDPSVESVESGPLMERKQPRGIPVGGTRIKVMGQNFHSIQFPKIYVFYDNQSYTVPCYRVDFQTHLICESPVIKIGNLSLDPDEPLELEYGFIMDDVQSVKNLKNKTGLAYLLYPNPIYDTFDNGVRNLRGDYLTLAGKDLDRACSAEDVEVHIGDEICAVTSISREKLICRLPSRDKFASENNLQVVVKVGSNLSFNLGNVSYRHLK